MTRQLLLIATSNPGKLAEYEDLFRKVPYQVVRPAQAGVELNVEEDGATFQENAVKKARAFAQASGLLTVADDSGIEVDALDGRPGVLSSRYAGPGASDEDRVRLLLREMKEVPWEKRTARFRCVIAIARPNGPIETCEGTCEGMIAHQSRGANGFGYDPVFYLPERRVTMAELPPEEKNAISHRGRAARKAAERLRSLNEVHAAS